MMGAADDRVISSRMMGLWTMAAPDDGIAEGIATYDGAADDGTTEDRSTHRILHLATIADVAARNAFFSVGPPSLHRSTKRTDRTNRSPARATTGDRCYGVQ